MEDSILRKWQDGAHLINEMLPFLLESHSQRPQSSNMTAFLAIISLKASN